MFSLTEGVKNQIKNANGRRKVRTLSKSDAEQFVAKRSHGNGSLMTINGRACD